MINEATLDVGEIWKDVTMHVRVKVKGMKLWQIRMWIMTKLIYFAAYVGGCGLEMESTFVTEEESDAKS